MCGAGLVAALVPADVVGQRDRVDVAVDRARHRLRRVRAPEVDGDQPARVAAVQLARHVAHVGDLRGVVAVAGDLVDQVPGDDRRVQLQLADAGPDALARRVGQRRRVRRPRARRVDRADALPDHDPGAIQPLQQRHRQGVLGAGRVGAEGLQLGARSRPCRRRVSASPCPLASSLIDAPCSRRRLPLSSTTPPSRRISRRPTWSSHALSPATARWSAYSDGDPGAHKAGSLITTRVVTRRVSPPPTRTFGKTSSGPDPRWRSVPRTCSVRAQSLRLCTKTLTSTIARAAAGEPRAQRRRLAAPTAPAAAASPRG